MYEIKKLDVLSVAKLQATIVGGITLVAMTLYTIIRVLSDSYFARHFLELDLEDYTLFGLLLVIGVSVVVGFASGAFWSFVYNLLAMSFGGVKMDITLESDEEQPSQPVQPSGTPRVTTAKQ